MALITSTVIAAAAITAVVAAAGGAAYSIYASQQQAEAQNDQYKSEANAAAAAADQEEAIKRRQLLSIISQQDAIRAGRGLSMTSGTALSIYNDTIQQGEQDISTGRLNALTKADRYRSAGQIALMSARDNQVSTGIGALGTTARAAGGGYSDYSAARARGY